MWMLHMYLLLQVAFIATRGSSLFSKGRTVAEIPNPMKDPLSCGRMNIAKSAVCDPDKLLTKDAKDEIEGFINAITNAQVAVAVIDKMSTSLDVDTAAEKFARGLHDEWGVGSTEKNDGVLVFLSIKDRVVYISTGDGVRDKLRFSYIQDIIGDMRPQLKKGDYGAALATSVIEIDLYLSGDSGQIKAKLQHHNVNAARAEQGEKSGSDIFISVALFLVFVAIGAGGNWFRNRKIQRYERGRAALDSLMRDVDNTEENNRFFTASCPICLEDFPTSATTTTTTPDTIVTGGGPAMAPLGSALEPTLTETVPIDGSDTSEQTSLLGGSDLSASGSPRSRAVAAAQSAASAPSAAAATTSTTSSSVLPGLFGTNAAARKAKALRCGHTFCAGCLEAFLRTSDGRNCPICRKPVEGPDDDDDNDRGGATSRRPFFGFGGNSSSSSGGGGASRPGGDGPRRSCAETFHSEELPTAHDDRTSSGQAQPEFTEASGMHQRSTASSSGGSSSSSSSSSSFFSQAFSRRGPELRYRLNRMRYLYPDVMTVELLRSMNTAIDRGSIHDFRSHITARGAEVTRLVADIRAQAAAAARSSGRGGSSGSFGGGRSSGGGGGRW